MFFPLSCSIKRKNKERKSCCNFLCHRTCSGKNRPDSLLHFPINGRSAPSQAPTSAHPAPERQKVKQARAHLGRRPPHHPICHLPLLHLGGWTHEGCDSSEQRRSPVRTQKRIKITSATASAISFSLPISTLVLCDGQATPDLSIPCYQKDLWGDIISLPRSHTEGGST